MGEIRVGLSGMFWGADTTGSGQYLRCLLSALADLPHSGSYTLFRPRGNTSAQSAPAAPVRDWILPVPVGGMGGNLAKVWFEQVVFPRACQQTRQDVAHVPYFAPPLFPTVATACTVHDLIPLVLPDYRSSLSVRQYMRLVAEGAKRARLILTDSQASARDIERLLHIPAGRIRVIYLAASRIFRPLPAVDRDATLERLGVPSRYLLYLGGFDPRKNVIGILRAFARAGKDLQGVRLVLAGRLPRAGDTFHPDPRVWIDEFGLQDRVRLLGWVAEDDKPALYGGALAFVFPSYYEGFGLPVLEAISCGAPAIIGSGSSLGEVAGPGAIAVPPADPDALAEAMIALVRDSGRRDELAALGLQHATGFSWEKTAHETYAAYCEICRYKDKG